MEFKNNSRRFPGAVQDLSHSSRWLIAAGLKPPQW
ncbi:hypothetical protein X773_08950 [Mesorhizobium sp. LSJC285A00]|nr:hypothetical protein X773_08950 [Mesorhizobium sp. LSJC285A00]ESX24865.1 hypothetical protein X765_26830 [Mesorhizobium sp. LSHC440B00]ESX30904.1 hypothetical protein X763_28135 [Mesorhizobium sp. LSHC432A00]ESX37940.1 hypothetical protein X764_23610 [Mesorhizobium sp. LSHC440A00]ESX76057.1 hypothetical protein X757_15075 [Mesorhizobium sp. LSHC414A00]ESY36757.1 hypothetical protein X747_26830 [Mesorhizobium sp. LNJC384A00]ESY50721.1 hypothetical protein X746_03725 [Mesorhizobium sp. LNJC3